MGKKRYTRRGDALAYLIADILARIAFFVGTAVATQYFFMTEYWYYGRGTFEAMVTLVASTLAAIFGPYLYHNEIMQGRGSLKDVKKRSREDR